MQLKALVDPLPYHKRGYHSDIESALENGLYDLSQIWEDRGDFLGSGSADLETKLSEIAHLCDDLCERISQLYQEA